MAFQIQYPPQTPGATESFMKGYQGMAQAQLHGLESQLKRKEIDSYESRIAAALEKSAADTELSQQSAILKGLEAEIKRKYGNQAAQADIAYKTGIGSSALSNAQTAQIQAYIAQQKLPGDLAQIDLANQLAAMQNKLLQDEILRAQGLNPNSEQKIDMQAIAEPDAKSVPDDYLPAASNKYPISLLGREQDKWLSESQRAGKKAEAETHAREDIKAYSGYLGKATDSSTGATQENAILDAMRDQYGQIPNLNKGQLMGRLEGIDGAAQIYESLKSGAALTVLGEDVKGSGSDKDLETVLNTFGNRKFQDQDMDKLLTLRQIFNDRKIEKQSFIAKHQKDGYTAGEIESAWNGWTKDNSIFDSQRFKDLKSRLREKMTPMQRAADEEAELIKNLQESGVHEIEIIGSMPGGK